MASTEKLVRFGLSNVHYAIYDSSAGTYGDPVAWPGAVSLSLEADGDTSDFWADNTKYVTFTNNGGYTGTLEMAYDDPDVLVDLLNFEEVDGVVYEPTDAKTVNFALMFEVTGNKRDQRTVLYNSTISRPSKDANTKTEATDVDTQSFDFSCTSIDMELNGETRAIVKASVEDTSDVYETFFDAVYLPGEESESEE